MLNQAFCLCDRHFGNLYVPRRRFVEGGADDFGVDFTLHVGDLFGPFVDQQDDQDGVGIVLGDAVSHFLLQHRFAGSWRGDDQAALSFSDWRDQVDDAHRDLFLAAFQDEPFAREKRRQVLERYLTLLQFRRFVVDCLDLEHGEKTFVLARRTDLTGDSVALAQRKASNLRRTQVNVLGAGQIAVLWRA